MHVVYRKRCYRSREVLASDLVIIAMDCVAKMQLQRFGGLIKMIIL